jgi:hypothetical protein
LPANSEVAVSAKESTDLESWETSFDAATQNEEHLADVGPTC